MSIKSWQNPCTLQPGDDDVIGDRMREQSVAPGGGGGALSSYKLMGMCRGMDSHCHDSIDQKWVIFLIVIRIGSRIFGILGVRRFW